MRTSIKAAHHGSGSGTTPVSFRLDEQYLSHLKREADKYGLSHGDLARRLVIDALEDTMRTELLAEIVALREQVSELGSPPTTPPPTLELFEEKEKLRKELADLRSENRHLFRAITGLREEFSLAVVAILSACSNESVSAEEAKRWVDRNLGRSH